MILYIRNLIDKNAIINIVYFKNVLPYEVVL